MTIRFERRCNRATPQNFQRGDEGGPAWTDYAAVRSTMRTMSAMMRLSSKSLGV
jgi:hypothetical protein